MLVNGPKVKEVVKEYGPLVDSSENKETIMQNVYYLNNYMIKITMKKILIIAIKESQVLVLGTLFLKLS